MTDGGVTSVAPPSVLFCLCSWVHCLLLPHWPKQNIGSLKNLYHFIVAIISFFYLCQTMAMNNVLRRVVFRSFDVDDV